MHPPRMVIYIDVDGTLIQAHGILSAGILDWMHRQIAAGYTLYLWSARGLDHAQTQAALTGTAHLFTAILPKPGYILDDQGWSWARWVGDARRLP